MMVSRWCGGVADNNMGLDSILSTLWRQRWYKTKLSYGFDSSTVTSSPDILEKMRVATQQAFSDSEWQRNSEFTFIQNPPGAKSDIMIGFYGRNHEKGKRFEYESDAPDHCLAYASPLPFAEISFHVDDHENWSIDPTEDQLDLVSVALHEIGHVLGLGHLSAKDAVMYPVAHRGVGKRKLQHHDIAALAAMYNQWGRFLRTIFS
ncbi:hypothetical protein FH972_018976 [Carpinus fangiana]|uniref:Peptidase metallopeptidase domain-containing protein n=1 Tax=Carpinus fangiana TaxID=176857 RepID=A0A5N6RNP9_9ROSI|nr:hypothetical protein FH972_018976 [Carpinus fangiana]